MIWPAICLFFSWTEHPIWIHLDVCELSLLTCLLPDLDSKDTTSLNSMLTTQEKAGQWQRGMQLLLQSKDSSRLRPDVVSVTHACTSSLKFWFHLFRSLRTSDFLWLVDWNQMTQFSKECYAGSFSKRHGLALGSFFVGHCRMLVSTTGRCPAKGRQKWHNMYILSMHVYIYSIYLYTDYSHNCMLLWFNKIKIALFYQNEVTFTF